MDRWTDGQTVRQTDGQAQTNMSPQLLRSWGHKKNLFFFFFFLGGGGGGGGEGEVGRGGGLE